MSATRWVTIAALLAVLSGCAALPRGAAVPESQTESATIPGIPQARLWLDRDSAPFVARVIRDTEREIEALRAAGKPTDPLPPIYALAISGGGDEGAFAAGILNGWTERGDRPQFKVVTGVSAGALIAPFAFLGARYDEVVRAVATTAGPNSILRKRNTLYGLASDGMTGSEPLAALIARYVTPEVLSEIAHEYQRGRALEIATTDLDAARQVTWNMGEIAANGSPAALELFRKIMLASASIPGIVSPVFVDVDVDGRRYQEMHVDGAVTSQVFLYPRTLLRDYQRATGQTTMREIHTFVIRNGRLEPDWTNTPRRTLPIGSRALHTLVQTQGINDVLRLYEIARQDHADFNLAYIGADFKVTHCGEFDTEYMRGLFAYGRQAALEGRQWHPAPPNE